MKNKSFYLTSAFIFLATLMRLIPHPPNFTPIMSVALFSGCYFRSQAHAILIPLVSIFLSDLVLGFHSSVWAVYLGLIGIVVIGSFIKDQKSTTWIFLSSLVASFFFFLLTNFAVWTQAKIYPLTLDGLIQCYYMGLPFLRNSVLANIFYSSILFSLYHLASKKMLCNTLQ